MMPLVRSWSVDVSFPTNTGCPGIGTGFEIGPVYWNDTVSTPGGARAKNATILSPAAEFITIG
jgi:hypothetical protein